MRAHHGDRCPVAFAPDLSLSACFAAQGQNDGAGPIAEPTVTFFNSGAQIRGLGTHPSPLGSGHSSDRGCRSWPNGTWGYAFG